MVVISVSINPLFSHIKGNFIQADNTILYTFYKRIKGLAELIINLRKIEFSILLRNLKI